MVEYSCNPSTGEAEGLEIQGYPLLHRELEASLGNVKPCLKEKKYQYEFNEHLLCASVRNVTINRMDPESLPVGFSPGGVRRYTEVQDLGLSLTLGLHSCQTVAVSLPDPVWLCPCSASMAASLGPSHILSGPGPGCHLHLLRQQ